MKPENLPDRAAPAAAIVRVRGLGFAHPGEPPVFAGWDADIAAGVTVLQGDTGSGKTTLLRLLAGELAGDGEVTVCGSRAGAAAAARREDICWFDPRDDAFDALTAAGLQSVMRKRHPALDEAAWQRHVAGFGLGPHAAKPMYALSTGSRRKAGLAVALSSGCALTLLDDASAGLDRAALTYLAQALAEAQTRSQQALLLVCSPDLVCPPQAGAIVLGPPPPRG